MVNKALLFGGLALLLILIIIIIVILVLVLRPKPKPQPLPPVPLPLLGPVPVPIPTPTSTPTPTTVILASQFTADQLAFCQQQVRSISIDPNTVEFIDYNLVTQKCNFKYKPIVACPPNPKQLPSPTSTEGQAILASRQGLAWTQQKDTNWVGNNGPDMCRADVYYYGTIPFSTTAADLCKQKCQLDSDCKTWVYNNNNKALASVPYEGCWGLSASQARATNNWRGFTSGGY